MLYGHRCEGVAELVRSVQDIELAHRNAVIFRAYQMLVAGHSTLLVEYSQKQKSQRGLHDE